MKVAFPTPPIFTIPPRGYGGEQFIYDLACGLDALGVETHIFGIPGSQPTPNGFMHYIPSCDLKHFGLIEQAPAKFYKEMVMDPSFVWHDFTHSHIVHDFLRWHGRKNSISTPWGAYIIRPFWGDNLVCWSQFHRQLALKQGYPESTRFVHGCTNTDMYCPDPDKPFEKGNYFFFYARMHPDKRPDIFIALAEALPNETFILSGSFGKTGTPDHAYYGRLYAEMASRYPNIKVMPDVSKSEAVWLMRHAKAVIHPSVAECFGLVIVESLACGTPVIASRDGAFPEILIEGKTGFLCDNFDQYVNAVKNVDVLNPEASRADAVKRFSRECSAKGYLKIYEDTMNS